MSESNKPAFPIFCKETITYHGLTKREYFAGLAMQGELASQNGENIWEDKKKLASFCVGFADALIAELKKSE